MSSSNESITYTTTNQPFPPNQPEGTDSTPAEAQVHQLDVMIHALNQRRAALLRGINSTRASTRHLPLEVLSTIFQFAVPPIDLGTRALPTEFPDDEYLSEGRRDAYRPEDHFQFVIGAVSHYWRQVVWSTPQLWTTLSIEISRTVARSNEALLNIYFWNARSLPMAIQLDLRKPLKQWFFSSPENRGRLVAILDSIKASIFIHNASKIRRLVLNGILPEWLPFINGRLSRCEELAVCWPGGMTTDWDSDLNLADLPCLRRVTVHYAWMPIMLPWLGLTVLSLGDLPTRRCLELLKGCPNLIQFRNFCDGDINHDEHEGSPLSQGTVMVLEHLELLEWHDTHSPWARAFLRQFRFNRLRTLIWSTPWITPPLFEPEEPWRELGEFFSTLPTTLGVFELSNCNYSILNLETLFRGLDHLTELRVTDPCAGFDVLPMIGYPISGWVWCDGRRVMVNPADAEGKILLSSLEILIIENRDGIDSSEGIVEMLENLERARGTTGRFRFELPVPIAWEAADRERIRGLLRRGFVLEIVENSQLLDFMAMDLVDQDIMTP